MTPEEIKEYDGMRGACHLFHTSAVFLDDISPIIMKVANGKLPVDLRANTITAIFLYALSAEIALKALTKAEGKEIPHRHDLKSLFENLDSADQNIIKNKLSEFNDFDVLLENNKNSFIEWRYFYEGEAKEADLTFLRKFSLELNDLCNAKVNTNS